MIYKYVYACFSWTFSIGKYIEIIDLCFSIFLPFPKECIPKHSVPLTKSAWRRHRSASGQRNAAALWHHRATLLYKTIIIIITFIYAALFYTELQSALQIKRKKAKQPNKNKCLRTIVWQVLFFLFLLLWNKKYHKWKVYQAKHKK